MDGKQGKRGGVGGLERRSAARRKPVLSSSARIVVKGIKVFAYHGCTRREREEGQNFLIDVELEYDAGAAVRSDDLSLAVDYDRLASEVHALATENRYNLIETLAAAVGARLMDLVPASRILVRVRKPEAPMECEVEGIAVEMEFRRTPGG